MTGMAASAFAMNAACVVYGNGAMARVIARYLEQADRLAGVTVARAVMDEQAPAPIGFTPVPFEDVERFFPPERYTLIVAVGYVEMNRLRIRIARNAIDKGYTLGSFVHPVNTYPDDVTIGGNVVVLEHVSLHSGVQVEDHTIVTGNVNLGHDCWLGAGSFVNGGVALGGDVRVGARTFLGINATVRHAVEIGEESLIGAHAFVARDVPERSVMMATPAEPERIDSVSFAKLSGFWPDKGSP